MHWLTCLCLIKLLQAEAVKMSTETLDKQYLH